ncbi:MAG TPA: glycosyltransferase family 2 protein [Dongiaceae bacterium]|nr:glycosyltransferase family 2 protein [Dongiaceae bacterium]
MRLSIIIVNWNGRDHLTTCLDSLALQTFRDFEVILVDNGSTDGSIELVGDRYSWVRLVELPENRGFAAGNNAGLTVASGEYIVTLNNDTEADPGWLAELVAVADAHPGAGMVGSRICNFLDRDRIDSLGFRICRDGMSRGACRLQSFSGLSIGPVEDILFPSACVALYRRAMLDETGFFDEAFFAYCEDTDLGLRGRLAGWGAVLARDAVVWHKYSQTAGTFSPLKLYLVQRNHYWVALKTFPASWLLLLPFFTVVRFAVQAATVLGGKGAGGEFLASGSRGECVNAILRGMRDAFASVPAILRKRAGVMRTRKLPAGEFAHLLRKYRMSFRELLS